VLLWHAHNEKSRDFRVEEVGKVYQSKDLQDKGDGVYDVELEEPASGWSAYFVQCEFDVGATKPLRYTTGVRILPEERPHVDKPIPLQE
jgi:PhoPQ-activated pathogenicity-related protein